MKEETFMLILMALYFIGEILFMREVAKQSMRDALSNKKKDNFHDLW